MNPHRRSLVAWIAPWLAGFVAWTALACLLSAETAIWLAYRGDAIDWKSLLGFRLADWYSCGAFVPLFVYATRRWPLERRHLPFRLALHGVLTFAASVGKIALFRPVKGFLGRPDDIPFSQAVARGIISEMLAFGAVAAALHAFEFYRRYRERETLNVQLQARLSDAQLRTLRAQLNPHVLFNTLNAVTTPRRDAFIPFRLPPCWRRRQPFDRAYESASGPSSPSPFASITCASITLVS